MNIREYIDSTDPKDREDFENHVFGNVLDAFCRVLPYDPPTPISVDLWTDGDLKIMCRTGELAERIADAIEEISGMKVANTGYFDPAEDEASGLVDKYTGWWYVQ